MPPNLLALVIFEIWAPFLPELVWTIILFFIIPVVAGMTGLHATVLLRAFLL
jgi:hypothetical protein